MKTRFWPAFALAAAVVCFASCSNKTTDPGPPAAGSNSGGQANAATITIPRSDGYGASSFNPGDVTIPVNGTVTWKNDDQQEHIPTSDTGLFTGDLAAGAEYSRQFTTAGTYLYHCTIHAGMTGTITVK